MCHGQGKVLKEPSRKKRQLYKDEKDQYELSGGKGSVPKSPEAVMGVCVHCKGSGLMRTENAVQPEPLKYPHVAIVGGGIGGTALAVACLHRGIPFTLYEKDRSFDARSQGYGLTLQQASKAMEGLGFFSLDGGITSTRHVVHTPEGNIIGEWGLRKWEKLFVERTTKRKNVHIARQTLRSLLLQALGDSEQVKWGHTLTDFLHTKNGRVELTFKVGENQVSAQADLLVGADGIFSVVRNLVLKEEEKAPLQYLGCIVILGICSLESLRGVESPLLDSATVFQTVNGHERIYMMPYDQEDIMWQLSFPLSEAEAKQLSAQGAKAMKEEAQKRLQWHVPIPQILEATQESEITGYPVYDRKLFDPEVLKDKGSVTLLGDAAHPMSPFKGQGANQALLDALLLARMIRVECDKNPQWRERGMREVVLNGFEEEMAARSASKVEDSARAARLLHSKEVLEEGDAPRGRG